MKLLSGCRLPPLAFSFARLQNVFAEVKTVSFQIDMRKRRVTPRLPLPPPASPRLTPSIKVRGLEDVQSVDRPAEAPVDTQSFLQLHLNVFCGPFGFLAVFVCGQHHEQLLVALQTNHSFRTCVKNEQHIIPHAAAAASER